MKTDEVSKYDFDKKWRTVKILKSRLESKYGKTIDCINEQDLPQIKQKDLNLAIAGIPCAFVFIIIALIVSIGAGVGLVALLGYAGSLFGVIPTGAMRLIAIGIIVMVWVSLKSVIQAFSKRDTLEIASLLPEDDNQIRGEICEVCKKLNTPMPRNILLSFNPTFYVTEAPVKHLEGRCRGRTLVIGIAFLRYLTNNEFKSIVSHEMGHFTGKDTLFSVYVAPVYKAILGIFDGADQHADTISLPILPMIILLKLFYTRYAILERSLSRQREMRADYIATLLYGEQNFRSALTKVVNFSTLFSSVWVRDYVAILKEGRIFKNYFSFFDSKINAEALGNEDFINDNSDIFSSHCSTRERFNTFQRLKTVCRA